MPYAHKKIPVGDFKATPAIYAAVNDVLHSGVIGYGKYSKLFEKQFAQLHDCKYAILSNSGTSALQIALQAVSIVEDWLGVNDGWSTAFIPEVIVPATTFIATANIVRHNGMRPVFCDVDERTFNIDARLIGPLVTPYTRAVIPVHLLGLPAKVDEVRQTVRHLNNNIKIIEDSCECMFVNMRANSTDAPNIMAGKKVGSLGDIGCFSTYVAHILVTGVGGLCTTNNADYAAKMRSLANHGLEIVNLNDDPEQNFAPKPMMGRRFTFDSYGHSYRVTEFESALGYVQLQDWQAMLDRRASNAHTLRQGIDALNQKYDNIFRYQQYDDTPNAHAHMMYAIVLAKDDNGAMRDKQPLTKYLNSKGVETRDIPSLLGHKVYSMYKPQDFPVSEWLMHSGFYVGTNQYLDDNDMNYILDILDDYCETQL
jgi:dTDP-4-amino-4,6-dideoxygalactose transaminase